MSKPLSLNCVSRNWLCGLAGLALFASHAHAQYDPEWTKNFRLGALTGLGIKGHIKLRGEFGVNGSSSPGATGVSGVDHVYDDGYVRVDDTGNAQGYTSYWGYENASQYDSGSQTLLMHSSSSFSADGGGKLESDISVGFELAYGQNIKQWNRVRLGWEFGFGYLPVSLKERSSIAATVNRSTFSFNVGDIVMPTAPFNGGSSGIGSTIHDVATEVSSETVDATLVGSRSLDVSLYLFRLGPTLFYDLHPRVGLSGGIGPAIGIASQTCTFNESLIFADNSAAQNVGEFGKTSVVYGAYINFIATFHVEEQGDLYLGVQYMPMSGSTFSNSGREAHLDLGGQVYFSLGVNWIF